VSNGWEDGRQGYDSVGTRIRDRDRWEIVLGAALILGLAAVIAALTRAIRDDNGWGVAAFPLATVSVAFSAASGGWWLVDRHRKNQASASRILTVLATLGLTPLLVLLLMMPKGSSATLVALDATTGRQLWRVHPQAIWLGIPAVDGDVVSVKGLTFKTACGANQFRLTFSRLSGHQQSRESAGFAEYPPRRITAVDAQNLNNGRPRDPQGNPPAGPVIAPSPDLEGPAAAGFRLDRPSQRLIRLDPQGRPLWSAPIPIVSEQSIVTTMIAQNVVYVAVDGRRNHNCGD
jgi:hypothetical protein